MNSIQQMVFDVDRIGRKINVSRMFAAPINLVWDAWTRPEIMDQWWAPKPWRAETKRMDFREGGQWIYAMVGPENEKLWCSANYVSIHELEDFRLASGFCDENGTVDTGFPSVQWHVRFEAKGEETLVEVEIRFDAEEHIEKYIEMGFREGFTAGLNNLDEWLASNG
jgi:PhnB protein